MPVLPTIADLYRVTIVWNDVVGVSPRNVLHIHQASGSEAQVAAAFASAYTHAIATDNPWAPMGSDYITNFIEVLKLDGSSATQTEPLGLSIGGSGSGQIIPASAAVMSLHTGQRGARGRGRQYVGPTTEGNSINGTIDTALQLQFVSGWEKFQEGLGLASTPASLHVASYVHADSHEVTSFRADRVLGTQRRRQDQLR